jgi:hypothetical protein
VKDFERIFKYKFQMLPLIEGENSSTKSLLHHDQCMPGDVKYPTGVTDNSRGYFS